MTATASGGKKGSVRGRGRELLLEAARILFAERGYLEVSTREIADRAGVSEPMLFRHFGSKRSLFEEAVFTPFSAFLTNFIAEWEHRPHAARDPVDEARELYSGFYAALSQNRQLVRALVAAEALRSPAAEDEPSRPALGEILAGFEKVMVAEAQARGFRSFDPTVLSHVMFGMVLSVAIHGDWMSAGSAGPAPAAEAYIEEMAVLTIHGLAHPLD